MIDCNPMYLNLIFMAIGIFTGIVATLMHDNKSNYRNKNKSQTDFDFVCSSLKEKILQDEILKKRLKFFNVTWNTKNNVNLPDLQIEFEEKLWKNNKGDIKCQ